ncbi:hypothetical protein FLAVO9AF_510014 [Flavobacterium sp. 9AF]|uniref:hypothetical protein n=1 Tax=Flavobacterium sp. 9AF TaxID=2653142 RepID=UPI0012F44614|nr:hypothetical protein [Flavobacterium sp. 9AF]VXC07705.1 hypothetical protein FLAVO9AF_510014 [Flavobacterium sp. 9AF]
MKHLFFLLLTISYTNSFFCQNIVLKGIVDPSFINTDRLIYYNYDSKKLSSKKNIKITDTIINGHNYNFYKLSIPFKKAKKLYFNDDYSNKETSCIHKIDILKLVSLAKKEKLTTIHSDIIVDNNCQIRMYNMSEESENIANRYTGTYEYIENGIKKQITLNQMFDSYFSSNFIDSNLMNSANGKWKYIKEKKIISIILNYEMNKEIGIKRMLFTNKTIEINIIESNGKEEFSINNINLNRKI